MQNVPNPLEQRDLVKYLWAARGRFGGGVALAMLRSVAIAPCTLIIQRIIDRPMEPASIPAILQLSGWFILCLVFHYIFSVWGARSIAKSMAELMVEMRSRIFFRLQ